MLRKMRCKEMEKLVAIFFEEKSRIPNIGRKRSREYLLHVLNFSKKRKCRRGNLNKGIRSKSGNSERWKSYVISYTRCLCTSLCIFF